jgi:flagellar assembly protein FliH
MSYSPWLVPKAPETGAREPRPETVMAQRMARVITPDENQVVTAMAWKKVTAPGKEGQKKAEEAHVDYTAQVAELTLQWEHKAREAYAAGVREGETVGRNRGLAEVQPVIDRLGRSIEEITQLRPRLRKEAESDTIRLALAIARRVLRRDLAIDPGAMHGLVLAALERLQGQEISRVKVYPSHAAQVTALLRSSAHNAGVEVIPDASLEPGGIVFETSRGDLDASVDSQLQEIERGLTDRLRKL